MSPKYTVSTGQQWMTLASGDTCTASFNVPEFGDCQYIIEMAGAGIEYTLILPGGVHLSSRGYAGVGIRDTLLLMFGEPGSQLMDSIQKMIKIEAGEPIRRATDINIA